MNQVATDIGMASDGQAAVKPPVPESLEDTGLSAAFVSDLLLKTLYFQGARNGTALESFVRLSFSILDPILVDLQERQLVEVRRSEGHGRIGYTFDITGEGRTRAREVMQSSRYAGPAPIPLGEYWESVRLQSTRGLQIGREAIRKGFGNLVFEDDFYDSLGPAINSGKSLFLYGHAGNGKTSIAEAIAEMMGSSIYLPYAVEVDGQIIQIYDPVTHRSPDGPAQEPTDDPNSFLRPVPDADPRFAHVRRPVVMVGGELVLDELELRYDQQMGVFRAPPQVKANCGVFIIDDFGRQRVRPRDLLNRWMVPLDRHMDFLSLPMGHKLPMPFECLLIFATNLNPAELVEEAFLRRIQYKILVDNPSREQYTKIFNDCCAAADLSVAEDGIDLVFSEFYEGRGIPARACHPRDIVNHVLDLARYLGVEPVASGRMLELACRSYFLDVPDSE